MSNSHNFEIGGDSLVPKFSELRKERGFTQKDLAKELGVDQSAVSLWESGKTFPRVEVATRLAKFFGCTLDELFAAIQPEGKNRI